MTKEEAKTYLENYRKMYADLAPERFLEALDCILSQPSLPSDLDEAAEKYSENILANNEDLQDAIEDAFKAGAEWMAGQGVTEEYDVDEDGIFLDSDSLGVCLMAYPPSELDCEEGDSIVIQIRKKQ